MLYSIHLQTPIGDGISYAFKGLTLNHIRITLLTKHMYHMCYLYVQAFLYPDLSLVVLRSTHISLWYIPHFYNRLYLKTCSHLKTCRHLKTSGDIFKGMQSKCRSEKKNIHRYMDVYRLLHYFNLYTDPARPTDIQTSTYIQTSADIQTSTDIHTSTDIQRSWNILSFAR